ANTPVVQKGAATAAGGKELVARWIVHDRLRDLPVLGERNGYRIDGQAMNEVGGAVQGINDPLIPCLLTIFLVSRQVRTRLFAQKPMVGIRRAQDIDNRLFSSMVHFRDIIFRPFA